MTTTTTTIMTTIMIKTKKNLQSIKHMKIQTVLQQVKKSPRQSPLWPPRGYNQSLQPQKQQQLQQP